MLSRFLVNDLKLVSLASSKMKNVFAFLFQFRFLVKLICYIAFDQHLVLVVYLNLLHLTYNFSKK